MSLEGDRMAYYSLVPSSLGSRSLRSCVDAEVVISMFCVSVTFVDVEGKLCTNETAAWRQYLMTRPPMSTSLIYEDFYLLSSWRQVVGDVHHQDWISSEVDAL